MVPPLVADQVEERDFLEILQIFVLHCVTRPVDLLVNVLGIAGGGAPVQFMALKGSEIEGI